MDYDIKKLSDCKNVFLFDSVTSTQDVAKQGDYCHGAMIIAKRQSGARGRLSRTFFCDSGGVYMTVVLKNLRDYSLITCAAAVAVKRAVKSVCKAECMIKWVNDIIYRDKKVCGILTEGISSDGALTGVAVGIGVNFSRMNFPPELRDIAISLGADADLASDFVIEIRKNLLDFVDGGAEFMTEYRTCNILNGKVVTADIAGRIIEGRAIGVSEKGALIIDANGTVKEIMSGEVTRVRRI